MLRVHLDRESSSRASIAGLALDHLPGWSSATGPADADLSIVAGALDDRLGEGVGAAAAGRVLVLAPLALDLEMATRLCDSLAGTPSLYGEAVLHSPYMERAIELAGLIPSITYVEATALRMLPDEDRDGVTQPFVELASDRGDVLLDQGSQAVAAILAMIGETTPMTMRCVAEPDGARARLTIGFDSGATAQVIVGWARTAVWDVQVAGSSDVVRLELAPNTGLECQGQPVEVPVRAIEPQQLETMGFLAEVEDALAVDSIETPKWPIQMGVRVIEIIDAARRSLDAGDTVPVTPG